MMTISELRKALEQFKEQSCCYIDCYCSNAFNKFDVYFKEYVCFSETPDGYYYLTAENGTIGTVKQFKNKLSDIPDQDKKVYLILEQEFGIEEFKITEVPFFDWKDEGETDSDFPKESSIVLIQSLRF